jgi:CHAD domain-containing protein
MNEIVDAAPEVFTLSRGFAKAVREHLAGLRLGEEKIRRDGDPDGVHRMRTSCRRLRATIKYLGTALPRETRAGLQNDLRRLMAALGPVRDLDVLRAAIGAATVLGEREAASLRDAVDKKQVKVKVRMQAALDGELYPRLQRDLEAAASLPEDGVPASYAGAGRIGAALEGVMLHKPADWATASEESLHELRKGVKKLRYALEAFAPAYGRPMADAIDRCRDLQETLGALQDAAVFGTLLKSVRTFAAGQFTASVRVRADVELRLLPEVWKRTLGSKAIARLGSHLFRRAVRTDRPAAAPAAAPIEERREAV